MRVVKAKRKSNILLKIVVFFVCVYSVVNIVNLQMDLSYGKEKLSTIKTEYNQQMEENKKLEHLIEPEHLDEYIERVAREKGYVKANEKVFVQTTGN